MLRPALRFPALFALTLSFLPLAFLARATELAGCERLALRLAAAIQRVWARAFLRVLGVELVVEGRAAGGASLFVANHVSYLDIVVLAALFPGRFVAKSEIAGWPVLGQMAAAVGTIFVDQRRARDVLRVEREMARTLAAGVPVLLFPEGHSTRGERVDRLKSSLLDGVARAGLPCLALTLHYETPRDPWAPAATVCWWGGMGFWRHALGLVSLRNIRARVRLADAARTEPDRKALAAVLHADLCAHFEPVRQAPIAPDCPWAELFTGSLPRSDGAPSLR
jgi:1-acyl-sn-glycerol-3-phosphate acyltransferase